MATECCWDRDVPLPVGVGSAADACRILKLFEDDGDLFEWIDDPTSEQYSSELADWS